MVSEVPFRKVVRSGVIEIEALDMIAVRCPICQLPLATSCMRRWGKPSVADQCGEVDAGKVSIQIPNVGFLLLTGYAVGFPISDDAGTSSSSGATVSLSGDVAAVCCYARTNHSRTAHKTID